MKDWAKSRVEVDTIFTDAKAGKMSVPEFAQKAQGLIEQLSSF
jgi:hypothetical protein